MAAGHARHDWRQSSSDSGPPMSYRRRRGHSNRNGNIGGAVTCGEGHGVIVTTEPVGAPAAISLAAAGKVIPAEGLMVSE
jgi:hypothetical protein